MSKRVLVSAVGTVAALILLAVPSAFADSGPRVIETGRCSGASDWKLKVKREDGGLEVEYEIDQNVNGDRWRVVLRHNGDKFADVIRRTRPPSGSFEVERIVNNRAGEDRIRARARNRQTGEICRGRALF